MVNIRLINITSLLVLLLTIFSQQAQALSRVTASIDKNPAVVNESIVLTVVADDDVSANALDTSILRNNFVVGRTSVSSQTNMVNFSTTRTTRWSTVLIPRKSGTVIIPALTIENKQTQPIKLTVLADNDPNANQQKNIFITTEISNNDVYVQQLLSLTVKLHFSAELRRGSLSEPTLAGANIVQIGADKESDSIINGKRFRIIERVYAISPQQSGKFVLSSPRFSGEILMPSSRRSNFLSFGETKPVSIIGKDISLNVRPIPLSYQGQWLPSELISLHQEWQPDGTVTVFTVGEPITRTITLTAAGLSKEQLPKIMMDVPQGLKIYPDQAELHSNMSNNRLVSQQVRSFAIVASKAGTYQLPEITIPWWNTVTNKKELATIPAQTITVTPNLDFVESNNANSQSPDAIDNLASNSSRSPEPETIIIVKDSWLQWLFLALWLLTSLAWLVSVFINRSVNSDKTPKLSDKINDDYLAILAACKQNQAEKTLALIVPWIRGLQTNTASIASLDEVNSYVNNQDFSAELTKLQQFLYGKKELISSSTKDEWQGIDLLKMIQSINKHSIQNSTKNAFSINP